MPRKPKPAEQHTKPQLAVKLAALLSKDELVALYNAVLHGYRPYASTDETPADQ